MTNNFTKTEKLLSYMKQRFPQEWKIYASEHEGISIRDVSIDRGRAFIVKIQEHLSFYSFEIRFEDFASELMNHAGLQLASEHSPVRRLLQQGMKVTSRLYKQSVELNFDPATSKPDGWWLDVQYSKPDEARYAEEDFADLLLSFLLLLFPYDAEAEEEGAVAEILQDKYERSRVNRALCLAFHGYDCMACKENLKDKYGSIAHQFIHVHHLNPVSSAGQYVPDPVRDMVPLCPNCHAVAHRRNPPFTVEEIQDMLKK